MPNSLMPIQGQFIETDTLNADYYVAHYKDFLVHNLADGRPADDTKTNYFSHINQFLVWCSKAKLHPLQAQEYHIQVFREWLYSCGLKVTSVAPKLTALRCFYQSAVKLKLIEDNPAKEVRPGKDPSAELPTIKYLTAEQLEYLIQIIPADESEEYLRDRMMVVMMGVEGLRTIEVQRMNIEDIDWDHNIILIHGKGHNGYIFPREDVMELLKQYLSKKTSAIKDKYGTPIFTVVSNNHQACRMSRTAVRDAIDRWLKKAEFKDKGLSCHLLRHTCGSLLYAETKDLQIVKETLRHKDLKMSSKYAHLQNRMLNRYTKAIPIKII